MNPGRQPPIDYLARTREQYSALGDPPYRWAIQESPPPFVPLRRPVCESRLALVASGGIYRHGQVAFHHRDDLSFRILPSQVEVSELRISHFAYDARDARRDPNVVFPIEPLRHHVASGRLGGLGPRAYTFMGGIYSSARVRERLAPAIARCLQEDAVDLVLLVPV